MQRDDISTKPTLCWRGVLKNFLIDKWGYIAGILFLAAIMGMIAISIKMDNFYSEPELLLKKKQYSHEIADHVRYFDYEFIDRELFTFKNCRIKKMRQGAFTFGAFNILVLDDLVINLPAVKSDHSSIDAATSEASATNSFARVFSSFKTMGKKRFSGIEINHLTINKYITANQYIQIEAQRAASSFKRTIDLQQCTVSTNSRNRVSAGNAVVEFRPSPVVRYRVADEEHKIDL